MMKTYTRPRAFNGKTKIVNVIFPYRLYVKLKQIAERDCVSMSHLIRGFVINLSEDENDEN
jgi:hypothetical protein